MNADNKSLQRLVKYKIWRLGVIVFIVISSTGNSLADIIHNCWNRDTYSVEITFVIENIWPEPLYESLIIV